MKKTYLAALATCALFAGNAHADELYAGFDAGLANLNSNWTSVLCCPSPESEAVTASGFIGGVHAGLNHYEGQWMFGVESDLDFTNVSTGFDGAEGLGVNLDFLGSLRGRLGVQTGTIMPYLTAGLAVGDFGYNQLGTEFVPNFLGTGGSMRETKIGFVGGAGVEMALAKGWTGRAEALYYSFGTTSGRLSSSNGLTEDFTADGNVFVARVGVSYYLSSW